MSLFKTQTMSIIKDAAWLQPLSNPPGGKPLCRDSNLRLMAEYASELFTTGQARNLFIYGKPGTGKTLCAKYLLDQIRKHQKASEIPVLAIYVNAGKTRTPYYTMAEIMRQAGTEVPCAGWQMFRLKRSFEQLLENKSVVIAIDEVDAIIFKEKDPLVYYLNRQPKTTLILISNNVDDVVRLPERALSTLQPVLMYAKSYTAEEIRTILKERVEHAFKPGTISDKLLTTIAKTVCEVGDVRFGFRVLLSAALLAEKARRQRIEADDVMSAVEEESRARKIKELEDLRDRLHELKKKRERD
jgi:cell division control protein 6